MYTPYTWTTGEVITAEKLNKLEQGVGDDSPFIINGVLTESLEGTEVTLDKTFAETSAAISIGKIPVVKLVANEGTRATVYSLFSLDNERIAFNHIAITPAVGSDDVRIVNEQIIVSSEGAIHISIATIVTASSN